MSGPAFQQILAQNDWDACLRFLSQATEPERRAVSGTALAAMPTQGPLASPYRESRWWQVRAIAVLASCSFAELKQRGWLWLPDSVKLGEVMGRLLLTDLIQRKHWANELGQVARASPLHAHMVRSAVERSLRDDPRHTPQDLYALLELLRELVFEAGDGIHSETARAFLQHLKPTTRAGKAAQVLLGCEVAAPAGRWAEIMPAVVERRLERAERWTRWRDAGRTVTLGVDPPKEIVRHGTKDNTDQKGKP